MIAFYRWMRDGTDTPEGRVGGTMVAEAVRRMAGWVKSAT